MDDIDFRNLKRFENKINYNFQNKSLILKALTTPEFAHEFGLADYEVLETIGDAVIKLVFILKKYNEGIKDPGIITKIKQQLENNSTLSKIAIEYFNLNEYIYKSITQRISGTKILADVFEAICGALYLDCDQDLKIVERKIIDVFYNDWDEITKNSQIFNKNILLEFLQGIYKFTPKILVKFKQKGPDDQPNWIAYEPEIYNQENHLLKDTTKIIKNLRSKSSKTKKAAEKDLFLKIYKVLKKEL
ncbi:MAG: hypothetical protein GF317_14580 [Candidatus Lokiarchaeota archaeon]|nr:hypothetical protein [Candidatus Lokiarchaeota archaeon]MBD3200833.1 hypothetical protein [Candidatus Lokiarchaeota archaeon]